MITQTTRFQASNYLNTYYLASSSEHGYAHWYYSNSITYKWYAELNVGNSNVVNNSNVAVSAAVHELGHIMGLAHSTATAIMNVNRDRTTIYIPKTDDLNGINAIY